MTNDSLSAATKPSPLLSLQFPPPPSGSSRTRACTSPCTPYSPRTPLPGDCSPCKSSTGHPAPFRPGPDRHRRTAAVTAQTHRPENPRHRRRSRPDRPPARRSPHLTDTNPAGRANAAVNRNDLYPTRMAPSSCEPGTVIVTTVKRGPRCRAPLRDPCLRTGSQGRADRNRGCAGRRGAGPDGPARTRTRPGGTARHHQPTAPDGT